MAAVSTQQQPRDSHGIQQGLYAAKVVKDRAELPKDLESRLQQAWLRTQINGRPALQQSAPSKAGIPASNDLGKSTSFVAANGRPASSSNQKAPESRTPALKRQRSSVYGPPSNGSGDLAGTLEQLWQQTRSTAGGDFPPDSNDSRLKFTFDADLSSATAASSATPGVEVESWDNSNGNQAEFAPKRLDTKVFTDEEILSKLEAGRFDELFGGDGLFGQTLEEDFYKGLDGLNDAFGEMEYHLQDVSSLPAVVADLAEGDWNVDENENWSAEANGIRATHSGPENDEEHYDVFNDILAGDVAVHDSSATHRLTEQVPAFDAAASGISTLSIEEQHAREPLAKIHNECKRQKDRMQKNGRSQQSGNGTPELEPATQDVEIQSTTAPPRPQKPHPVELLIDVAKVIVSGDQEKIQAALTRLSEVASVYGDGAQRLSAYFLQGLTVRLAKSRGENPEATESCCSPAAPAPPVPEESSTAEAEGGNRCAHIRPLMESFQVVMNASPYLTFGQVAANSAILEAFAGESRVHIIDFGSGYGLQWPALIQALAARPGGPPRIRLTAIEPRKGMDKNRQPYCLYVTGNRLKSVAKMWGVQLEYHFVQSRLEEVTPEGLQLRGGEAVAANCALRLHQLCDEAESSKDSRGAVLRTVRSLNPKVCTIVEPHTDQNSPYFLARFYEALYYYASLFESFDQSIPRDLTARRVFEQQILGKAIINVLAAEGQDRVERQEPLGQWQHRMKAAGFQVRPISNSMVTTVKALLQTYRSGYGLVRGEGSLLLTWDEKPLIAMSSWQPANG